MFATRWTSKRLRATRTTANTLKRRVADFNMSAEPVAEVIIRTHKGTGQRRVTRADLEKVVHLSQQGAASKLNIGVTRFKTVCRQLGFSSWPYRKVKSVENLKSTIADTIPEVMAEPILNQLEAVSEKLLLNPAKPLDEDFKKLRQAAYKKTHGQRKSSPEAYDESD